MAEQKVIHSSSASLSWIDEDTSLPEHDYSGPGTPISQNFVFRKQGFRFANFLEAEITVSDGRLVRHRFRPNSGYYGRHSAFGVPTLTFPGIQKSTVEKGRVVFRQTVGARTHTPETVARKLGVGIEKLTEALKIPYAPIWTTLELALSVDGTTESRLVYRSLFPSVYWYALPNLNLSSFPKVKIIGLPSPNIGDVALYARQYAYDGVPNLGEWKRNGWGPLGKSKGKVTPGNPWDYTRNDARESGKDGELTIEGVLETTGKTLYVVPKKGYPGI